MHNNNGLLGGSVGTTLSAIGTALQPNEVLQTISLVITIIGGLITFIIVPIANWVKKALKDGKIDKDEAKELVDIVADGGEKVKELTDNRKEGQ